MAGKSYIKIGSNNWDRIKKMYVKTGGQTWTAIRKAYIKTSSGWKKVFDTTSNRPFIEGNDIPKLRLNTFRTDSTAGSIIDGTADDPINPVVEAPPVQQMGPTQDPPNLDSRTPPTAGWAGGQGIGRHLWGYNGDWVSGNGSAITYSYDWLFSTTGDLNYIEKEFLATSSTGRRDMITNNSTHLGRDDGYYFDKNWIIFRVRATNSAGSSAAQSAPVYIVRQRPSGTITMIGTGVDVPETLAASITYSSRWYNMTDTYDSKVEWFAVDSADEALTEDKRVAFQDLYEIPVTGTTTKSGTIYHYATIPNKVYVARLTLNNSNTQAPVVPVTGFIPSAPFTVKASTSPGSPVSVTSLNILDYFSNQGTDNRGYIPVGGLFRIQSNVTGVDESTTYRIRYRMYNWQNQSYYGMDGTNYGINGGSSAWTTRTGSNTSFGPGGTLISNISVSGTTATLLHNEVISSSLFGSTTFEGGQDRWQIEIEVSALKNSIRKYYADVVGGIPYYVSRPATLLLTANPANAQVNQTVTLNGTITALGGGLSYPRQYKVSFGDGTDSGWQPVGGYSYGTSNPTFQITKQYSTVGEYYPVLTTIPDYSTTNTYVVVSAALNPPNSVTINSVSRYDANTVSVTLNHSGGSGPYYQMYWTTASSSPVTSSYDAAGTGSTITDIFSPSDNYTAYFYVRSSSENLGNTTTAGSGSAGTYSNYSSLSPNPSYTFLQPFGSVSVSPSSGTAGTTEFTATASVGGSPLPQTFYQWQYNDQGSLWLAAPGTSTNSTYTPPSNYNSIYGSLLRCQITANNGVGTPLVANSTAVTIAAAATKLSTPTNVSASDDRTDGILVSWTNVSNAATYGVWYGPQPSYDSNPDFGGPNNNGGVSITSSSFLDTSAPVGTRNYYVQAFPSSGSTSFLKSDWSAGDSGTRLAAPVKLSTPTGVSASDNRTDGINITWNAVSGASYYGIWWGGAPAYDSTPDFQNIFGTSYLDSGAPVGSRNYYVQAFASGNPTGTKSDWGGPDSGTRVSATTVPGSPNNVSASGITSSGATITWSAPSTDGGSSIIRYELNRDGGGFFSVGNVFSYNYFLSVAGTYLIGVRAVNSVGAGSASYVSVTIPAAPSPPSTPGGVTVSGSGLVSWGPVSGADSYEVLNYTDRSSNPSNTTNRLGPYTSTGITGTSFQLTSSQGYGGLNNYARAQVRARNAAGVSTYSAWFPSSTTYV